MNVILFDIDGTLILTNSAGQQAMEQVTPDGAAERQPKKVHYGGRTDRSIVADHLNRLGMEDTDENFQNYIKDFLEHLPASLAERNGCVLPGVIETLDRLSTCESIKLGLITGNLRIAAEMKLSHFKLDLYFRRNGDFVGGFGDTHHDRDDVARVALEQARLHLVSDVDPQDVWIIGDTPRDVKCTRAIGANILAVGTGGYSAELSDLEPDLYAEDLTQADAWWERLKQSNPTL